MNYEEKLKNRIKDRKGMTLLGILVAVIAFGILMFPIAKWLIALGQSIAMNEKRLHNYSGYLEMQSIVQDYWRQMNAATYGEFEVAIADKGVEWSEDIGDKYELTIKFSGDGKYAGAYCNVGAAPESGDRHCRNVEITIAVKDDPLFRENLRTTRVSATRKSTRLTSLENGIAGNESKFDSYYTKTEMNNRYVKKGERP